MLKSPSRHYHSFLLSSKTADSSVKSDVTNRVRDSSSTIPECIELQDHSGLFSLHSWDNFDLDETAGFGRRLTAYKSMRYFGRALLLWISLLAFSLTQAKVADQQVSLESFFNKTAFLNDGWARIHQTLKDRGYVTEESERPGFRLAKEGAHAKYPIIMIPGFVTSGLELWEGQECAKHLFRQRIWGAVETFPPFFNTQCWKNHLSLDPLTGMDPQGIRLRPAQGFEAADYFTWLYWVWEKLIQNLADVGYDGDNMSLESYDWRLAYPALEKRDGYFTKLKMKAEFFHKTTGKKVVLASHSMGGNVVHYFLAWVEAPENQGGGGGGKRWVDTHIQTWANIAGPLLGVPKAVPSILSGEMKDTNIVHGMFGPTVIEQFFGRKLRQELWSTWGSLWSMLPKGGDAIWGPGADMCNETSVVDGVECKERTDDATYNNFASLVQFTDHGSKGKECSNLAENVIEKFGREQRHGVDATIDLLTKWGAGYGKSLANTWFVSYNTQERSSPKTWHDSSRTPLPNAPNLKIYCMYGTGLDTERAFFYQHNDNLSSKEENGQCPVSPSDLPFIMDYSVEKNEGQGIKYGVKMVDGDASVPLISLGYMCVNGWKQRYLNPSGTKVITREYRNQQAFSMGDPIRGGSRSGEHVDILGNLDMTEDFIRIVTDHDSGSVLNQINSDIAAISKRIDAHPLGGLNKRRKRLNPLHRFLPKRTR